MAQARLKHENMEVLTALDGPSGLAMARDHAPDVILLDIDMPEMDGYEVCRRLKDDERVCMIPVIFLTGADDTGSAVQGLDCGAVDYISKPFDAQVLKARVRSALRTKHLQDVLVQYALIDPLTEIGNRRALMGRLAEEWSRMQRNGGVLSVAMGDVDRFKLVNDTFGHQVGDRVLRHVAWMLRETCRMSDTVGRIGGEEFLMLLPDTCGHEAIEIADRCRERISAIPIEDGDREVHVTVSFGVAGSDQAQSPEDLVRLADEALYRAKHSGRNRVCGNDDSETESTPPAEAAAQTAGDQR